MRFGRPFATSVCLAAALFAAQSTPRTAPTDPQQPPPQQPQPQQQQPPVFRGGTNFVYVDIYPRQDGRVVEGLTLDDFEILEDGKPQKPETIQFVRVEPSPEAERRDPNNTREMLQIVADPTNRAFVVFLDYLHVAVDGSYYIREPLVRAMDQIIGPSDVFAVTTPNDQPRHLVFGRRITSVEDQLRRYWPWGLRNSIAPDRADPEEERLRACFQVNPVSSRDWTTRDQDGVETRLDELLVLRRREDRTLASLEAFVEHLGRLREARTVIILVSDGWRLFTPDEALAQEGAKTSPSSPGIITQGGTLQPLTTRSGVADPGTCNTELLRLARLDNQSRFRALLERANRNNVSFYPITPSGLVFFDSPISKPLTAGNTGSVLLTHLDRVKGRVEGLQTLAENTDGIAIVNTNDLDRGLKRIVDDVSAYYLVGYTSSNPARDGRYRRIEVKVKREGVDVKARRGYTAVDEARTLPAPAAETLPPDAEAALGALGRLRPDAELFVRPSVAAGTAWVAAELGRAGRARDWATKGAPVRVEITAADGARVGEWTGQIAPMTRGVLATVALPAGAAGPWKATVTVGDGVDRLQDQVPFEPPPAGSVVGAPLLFRATPSARSPLYAVADSQFRRTERVHVEWPMAAALDQRSARLLDRHGKALPVPVTVTERDVDGQPRLAADVTLGPLADGEFFIELTVAAGGPPVRSYVAIRVTR